MSVRPPRIDHVAVTVADMDRSLAFYRDLLGLPLLERGETSGPELARLLGFPEVRLLFAELDLGGGQILELLQYLSPAGEPLTQRTCDPGSSHVALVVGDLDGLCAALAARGHTVRSAPVPVDEGDRWRATRLVYAVDPDGFTVELVERAADGNRL